MASLKDVARYCGVSVATVSKALNDRADIGEPTKARIREAAEELGYQANAAARALKTNRSYTLGVLFVDERRSGLAHEYFSAVLESFKAEAEALGYNITFINRSAGGRQSTYLQHCRYRGMDGVVIACVDFRDPQVLELVDSGIPLVTIDHAFNNAVAVVSDNLAGAQTLVRHVHSKGHRKIAFLHGEATVVTQNRLAGFHRACGELGIRVPEEYIRPCVYHDPQGCARATRELLELPEPPSCILFPDDFSALGGINALNRLGLRLGQDISAVGYDGIQLAKVLGLTTYAQDTRQLGKTAANRLVSLIEKPRLTPVERILISGALCPGSSVAQL